MIGRKYGVKGAPAWLVAQRLITGLLPAADVLRSTPCSCCDNVDRSAARSYGRSSRGQPARGPDFCIGEPVRDRDHQT